MTHKAKKIVAGVYEYRGYTVRNASEDVGYPMWNITENGSTYACDAASSFKSAKAVVDGYVGA